MEPPPLVVTPRDGSRNNKIGTSIGTPPTSARCSAWPPASQSASGLNSGPTVAVPLAEDEHGVQLQEMRQVMEDLLNKQTQKILEALKQSSSHDLLANRCNCPGGPPFDPMEDSAFAEVSNSERDADNVMRQHACDLVQEEPSHGPLQEWRVKLDKLHDFAQERQLVSLPAAIRKLEGSVDSFFQMIRDGANKPRGGYLDKFMTSDRFSIFCGAIIVVHTIITVFETNDLMENYATGLSNEYRNIEIGFLCWYSLELILRVAHQRFYFFIGPNMVLNAFDSFLVAVTLVVVVFDRTPIRRWGFLRSLRIVRIIKILRILRLLELMGLHRLQLMVYCIAGSVTTLFWCIVMLSFNAFLFSVYFVQSLAVALNVAEEGGDPIAGKDKDKIFEYFGSVREGMLSLLMAISGGQDWYEFWKVVGLSSPFSLALFLFYIFLCMIALLNIITSIFVEKALSLAKPDAQRALIKKRRKDRKHMNKLADIFASMGLTKSDAISLEQFVDVLSRPEFERFMYETGIRISDAHLFFSMLLDHRATGDDEVDINTLVLACMNMEGAANSLDVQMMRYELKELMREQKRLGRMLMDRSPTQNDSTYSRGPEAEIRD